MKCDNKLIVAGLLLLPTLVFVSLGDINHMVKLFPDDAFYYLQTAYNTANHRFISFDGLNPTNGFHPLQFLIATAIAFVAEKEYLLKLSIIENAVAVIFSSWVLTRCFFEKYPQRVQNIALVFLSFPIWYLYIWLDAGMEVGPVLFCTVLFYCAWTKSSDDDFRTISLNCKMAFFAAILVLARLDLIITLIPFALIYLYFLFKQKVSLAEFALPTTIVCLILLPYLFWNIFHYGHLVPVSGVVKSGFEHNIMNSWRALTGGNAAGVAIVILPIIMILIALLTSDRGKKRSNLLLLLAATILYYGYITLIAKDVFRWYLAFPIATQTIALSILFEKIYQIKSIQRVLDKKSLAPVFLMIAMSSQGVFYFWAAHINTTSYELKMIAEDINRKLSKDEVLATYDAGTLGFFCNVKVTNLDGLANSFEFYENHSRTGKFLEYFNQTGVTHLLIRDSLFQTMQNDPSNGKFMPDDRIILEKEYKLAEYEIPGQFSLILYKLNNRSNNIKTGI